MSQLTDRDYLLGSQYRDSSILDARIRLHEHFSTNPLGWHPWVFQQLDLPERCKILDVGCGPGHLWLQNLDRITPSWRVVLSDLSIGMVAAASTGFADFELFQFAALDVRAVPFPGETFDVVIANHMLHHVPRREQALSEVRRVLKLGGRFYATTNRRGHLRELRDFVFQFDKDEQAD